MSETDESPDESSHELIRRARQDLRTMFYKTSKPAKEEKIWLWVTLPPVGFFVLDGIVLLATSTPVPRFGTAILCFGAAAAGCLMWERGRASLRAHRQLFQAIEAHLMRVNKEVEKLVETSQKATAAADARHNQPGGSREKQRAIREAWANGKYDSRDICAEQECAGLNMSPSAARKALRNTPDPT